MANAPSSGTGWRSFKGDLLFWKSEILPDGLICRKGPSQSKNVENNPMQSNMASARMDALSDLAKHFDTSGKSPALFYHRGIYKR
jgi:hypothetical protein